MKTLCLIDDDNEFAADFIAATASHFETTHLLPGEEPHRLSASSKFDAVVVDLHLGTADGLQLLLDLKTRTHEECAFFLISSDRSTAQKVRGLRARVADFLSKDMDWEEIIERINLRVCKTEDPLGISLNVESSSLTRGDKTVRLTSTEFRILNVVVKGLTGNTPIDRDLLPNLVWPGEVIQRHTITSHISNLNSKIKCLGVRTVTDDHFRISLMELSSSI